MNCINCGDQVGLGTDDKCLTCFFKTYKTKAEKESLAVMNEKFVKYDDQEMENDGTSVVRCDTGDSMHVELDVSRRDYFMAAALTGMYAGRKNGFSSYDKDDLQEVVNMTDLFMELIDDE